MYYKIRNLCIWIIVALSLFVIFIPYIILFVLTFLFDKKRYIVQKFTQGWGTFYFMLLSDAQAKIEGLEKLKRDKPCIVISNHQSLLDIVVLFHYFAHFIWISKIENFRMPFLGWVMYLNGYIPLKRDDPRSFPKMFSDINKALKDNRPVLIFPEGTRSGKPQMGRFKEGAFKAAIDNKVPIQPIVLNGTYMGLKKKKNDPIIEIKVKVFDSVPYEKFPSYNPAELKEYFRNIMEKELEKLQSNVS